jgi:hypothetical protein
MRGKMKKVIQKTNISILFYVVVFLFTGFNTGVKAQVTGPQEIKWLWVGPFQHWFSNGGAEIEYGRRSRAFLDTDQMDGLRWPADYIWQDHNVGKALQIGTTNFTDPNGTTYPYKVISAGRLFMYLNEDVFPVSLQMHGKFKHPAVIVDSDEASDLDVNDDVDEINQDLSADRLIINEFHTAIGISCKREIRYFTNQNHNNYYITEYVFTNTGIIDNEGTTLNPPRVLTEVVFHFQHRYSFGLEAARKGFGHSGQGWGLNTVNDAIGQDPNAADFDGIRAILSWYGAHSAAPDPISDIGNPDHNTGVMMGGTHYAGVAVLHADRSASDHNDDPFQPTTTQYLRSDNDAQGVNQYDPVLMTSKYQFMTAGHPPLTHAEGVGSGYADNFASNLNDRGGISAAQGFGPYDMAPGDSIKIVLVEGIAGITRQLSKEIVTKWFAGEPYMMPDGSVSNSPNEYKNAWVLTGRDSLMQTFRRAIANYESGYSIPTPPPPPETFTVSGGGDKIILDWADNAPSDPNTTFGGYEIYRAVGRSDTTFDLIFECDANNVVHTFNDITAVRGFDYYYYIVSKDDGSANLVYPGVPLKSSKFYTLTNKPTSLKRPPGAAFSQIRIVPNPYNAAAQELQFGSDSPNRLAIYNIPSNCVIKIFTERGDLVETIYHRDGSGDKLWESLTSSGQLVTSGLYIAYIEILEDIVDEKTGEKIFKKGQNTFKKFVVIR